MPDSVEVLLPRREADKLTGSDGANLLTRTPSVKARPDRDGDLWCARSEFAFGSVSFPIVQS